MLGRMTIISMILREQTRRQEEDLLLPMERLGAASALVVALIVMIATGFVWMGA